MLKNVQHGYNFVKQELLDLELKNAKGSMLRSKARFIEEGEKPTHYFFNLEKRNASRKHIKRLVLPGGTTTTNPEEISEYLQTFYTNLYTSTDTSSECKEYFLQIEIPRLTTQEQKLCEGQLNIEECTNALKYFKQNKSPGNDGITIEFYRVFWSQLSSVLVDCYNYSYNHGELSTSQRQAIISLIEKHGKDKLYLKNWRPISLLNVDYKIATKTLALRIRKVLPSIINFDQTG